MNIDRLAPFYRSIEYCAFGRALERRRFAFLERLQKSRRILIAGEGDGRALARLLALAPEASIDVVEISERMIALARKRVGDTNRVRFIQEDARRMELSGSPYDGIVTCFFLDCFPEAEARDLIGRFARSLTPGGSWLVSDFAVPPHRWQHWHAKIWMYAMYRFFRIATGLQTRELPPLCNLLQDAGMTLVEVETERAGMLVSQVWKPY